MSILRGGFLGYFPFPATCSTFFRRCLVPNGSRPGLYGKAPFEPQLHPTTPKTIREHSRSMNLNVRTRSTSRRTGRW
jgi:hypothetical protein